MKGLRATGTLTVANPDVAVVDGVEGVEEGSETSQEQMTMGMMMQTAGNRKEEEEASGEEEVDNEEEGEEGGSAPLSGGILMKMEILTVLEEKEGLEEVVIEEAETILEEDIVAKMRNSFPKVIVRVRTARTQLLGKMKNQGSPMSLHLSLKTKVPFLLIMSKASTSTSMMTFWWT